MSKKAKIRNPVAYDLLVRNRKTESTHIDKKKERSRKACRKKIE